MSGFGPVGGGQNPFEGIFGDLARLLGAAGGGPLNWDVARQVAVLMAGEGQSEPNVDPVERIRLEDLVRVAELHVNQITGLDLSVRSVDAVTHVEWASRSLDAWKPLLEDLAQSLTSTADDTSDDAGAGAGPSDDPGGPTAMFSQLQQWMGPVILGMQAGGMVGHLSRRSLGQYELPIPRANTNVMVLIPANIKAFADDWTLPLDELSLYVAIEEATRIAVLSRPHVHERFLELISAYVRAFEPDQSALEESLGQFDITDTGGFPAALNDPHALLGAIQSPAQVRTLAELSALVAAFVGYVDYVVARAAHSTIPSAGAIAEACKRRRVEESDGQRLVEKLFGLELAQPTFDRGDAFIQGVIERSGEDALARLWKSAWELPTPAEVDAPGLWLERIDLPPPPAD